jgi:HD-GYP domain-containing protein (c-di-GMP phosphodiesterase class II)
MRLSGEQAERVATTGLVHDIGKIGVPIEILAKPGRLVDAELQLIRTHVQARILAVADVVEAMSTHRPYRAALGIETALAELLEGAGGSGRHWSRRCLHQDIRGAGVSL